jgi:acetoin utilization protein AcuB
MFAQDLINTTLPQLQLSDPVSRALELMNEFKATHLPVVADEKYLGLISEEDLLDEENKKIQVEFFQNDFIPASVIFNQHFLSAVSVSNQYQTNVIPVINEARELMGTISAPALMLALGNFAGSAETGAMIVLEMERSRFSISEISRIVESDGATILHLNITSKPDSLQLRVTLQLNKREISTMIAAFERYEYSVSYYSGEELFENELDNNYRHLMNYLDI